ncbi:tetratricopeptide repeat protein, partial [Bacillus amyloliquefaciens]|uniref:tetratricopeptide repeat protein n=1 Tax=Bacillus amyloliquefaciens TaxID=1390 RepID=UPI00197A8775
RIAWLERAISHRPDLAAGHFGLGHALLWTANWDKAIESFRRGLADHPLDFTAIAGLIAALTAAERRIEAADEYVAARRLFLTI